MEEKQWGVSGGGGVDIKSAAQGEGPVTVGAAYILQHSMQL